MQTSDQSLSKEILGHFILMFKRLICIFLLIATNSIADSRIPDSRKPTEREEEYGRTVAANISKEFSLDNSFENAERVRSVLKRVIEAANGDLNDWRVFVFKSASTKNLSAIRGNTVFVWTGMLKWLKSDDELAVALSHEIAHVLLSHNQSIPNPRFKINEILSSIITTGVQIGASAAGAGGIVTGFAANAAGTLSERLIEEPGKSGDEIEADEIARLLLKNAQYDESKIISFWNKAKRDPSLTEERIPFFINHPMTSERMKKLKITSSSENEPLINTWIVSDKGASIHVSASESSEVLEKLDPGTKVKVDETFGSWFFVVSPSQGYVNGKDLLPDDTDDFSH